MKYEDMKEGHWYQRKFDNCQIWVGYTDAFHYPKNDALPESVNFCEIYTRTIEKVREMQEKAIMSNFLDPWPGVGESVSVPVELPPAPTECVDCRAPLRAEQVSQYAHITKCVYCYNRNEHRHYGREDSLCGVSRLNMSSPDRGATVTVDNSFWDD